MNEGTSKHTVNRNIQTLQENNAEPINPFGGDEAKLPKESRAIRQETIAKNAPAKVKVKKETGVLARLKTGWNSWSFFK